MLIYRAFYNKIVDVIPINQDKIKYILVTKNGIFIEQIG